MPMVNGKKFPYTNAGKKAAKAARKKKSKKGFLERLSKGQPNIRNNMKY